MDMWWLARQCWTTRSSSREDAVSQNVWLHGNIRFAWLFGVPAVLFGLIAFVGLVMAFTNPGYQIVWWTLAIAAGVVAALMLKLTWLYWLLGLSAGWVVFKLIKG